jgi:NAD(P)-dependent dehydrogenase (short-subunit alcohol dehydrogenase family)
VTSGVGRVVIPFAGPYVASKFALEALAEVYRYELAGLGIDSVIVEPGSFGTGFIRGMMQPSDEAAVAAYGALGEAPKKIWPSLEKRLAAEGAPDPRDVAEAILALIEMTPGTRPLRTSVDALTGDGVRAINAVCDEVQKGVLAGFRMADAARGPKPRA